MMFTKDKPRAARDFSELNGDPFQVGNLSDAPSPEQVNSDLRRYDDMLDQQTMGAGVAPGSPGWEPVRAAIEDQHVVGLAHGEYPRHGDPLPMSARQFAAYSPQSTRDAVAQQSAFQADLWDEFQTRHRTRRLRLPP